MEPGVEAPAGGQPIAAVPALPCDRCGAFARLTRRDDGHYCAECLERMKHPIERGEITVGSIFAGTWRLLEAAGPKALLVTVALAAPYLALVTLWPAHRFALALGYGPAEVFVAATILGLCQGALDAGGRAPLGRSLAEALRRFGALLWVWLLVSVAVTMGTLLFVVPGVIFRLSFFVTAPIVLHESFRGVEALGKSYDRMKGHRLVTLVALLASFVPSLVGRYAGEIPRLVWLAHHPGLHLPPPTGLGALGLHALAVVGDSLPIFVIATLYAKTRHRLPPTPPADPGTGPAGPADDDGITELEPWELRTPPPEDLL